MKTTTEILRVAQNDGARGAGGEVRVSLASNLPRATHARARRRGLGAW
jgi:hypothetical protein